jgi:hypothetical protein
LLVDGDQPVSHPYLVFGKLRLCLLTLPGGVSEVNLCLCHTLRYVLQSCLRAIEPSVNGGQLPTHSALLLLHSPELLLDSRPVSLDGLQPGSKARPVLCAA